MVKLNLMAVKTMTILASSSGSSSYLTPINAGKTILLAIVAAFGVYRMIEGGIALSDAIDKDDRGNFTDCGRKIAAGGVLVAISVIVGLLTA